MPRAKLPKPPPPESKPETQLQRTERLLSAPDALATLCDHVASGGDLIDLADTWQVRYCDLVRWARATQERRAALSEAYIDRGEWMVQRVLHELKALGFSDIRKAFDENGNLLPFDRMPPEIAKAIQSVEVDELLQGEEGSRNRTLKGHTKKVKFWDKRGSLELLGKHLRMFADVHEVRDATLEDLVLASMEEPDVVEARVTSPKPLPAGSKR